MAFVAAAQRAALSGVTWPTQGFDPQGRATLSGLVSPESADPDLTNAERLAGIQGFSYPTNVNTEFGRGIVSGVFVPDAAGPDVLIETFQTEWDLIPTWSLALNTFDGSVVTQMAAFRASIMDGSVFTEGTVANIKALAKPFQTVISNEAGAAVSMKDKLFWRVNGK